MSRLILNHAGESIRVLASSNTIQNREIALALDMGHANVMKTPSGKAKIVHSMTRSGAQALIMQLAEALDMACELTPVNPAARADEDRRHGEDTVVPLRSPTDP